MNPLDEGRAAVLHGSSLPRSDAHGQEAAMRVSDYLSESLADEEDALYTSCVGVPS